MSQPQQILHVVGELDGYGQTQQLLQLVESQLSAGQQVQVVAFSAAKTAQAALERRGVRCRVLDLRWRRDPFVAVRLAGELRGSRADLLHIWGEQARRYCAAVRRFVPDFPQVVSLPEDSQGIASAESLGGTRQQFLEEQSLPNNAILIAVAGPLARWQRVDEAIWNFELVRTLEERVRLLIVGDGEDRHRCERFARLTSEPAAIRFLGYREDLRELLPHMDLFWHTADPSDAIPRTVLEAMVAEVPVVATDGPGCRRVIDDSETGYLVPNGDRAIFARHSLKLLEDQQLAKSVAKMAAESAVRRYPVEAMFDRFTEVYAEAMAGSARGAERKEKATDEHR